MPKIQFNGKQYTVSIPPDSVKRMKWKKGTEVYIEKDPDRNILYIEKMKK